MKFLPKFRLVSALTLLAIAAASDCHAQAVVEKISLSPDDPVQLQIQTTARVRPQAQIISGPERLVIDVPSAVPGPSLRNQNVNRDEVQRVRVGLFTRTPPVTRIVLDLKSPQWYRIIPASSGFTVTLGAGEANAGSSSENGQSTSGQTIGWVSAKTVKTSVVRPDPFVVRKGPGEGLPNGVRVQFNRGLLEVHARNATLSEVLFQIQKLTGAEIAIPSGTEQERVAADLGPAPASVVLAGLLDGSNLNFFVVGSEADPAALRSVILTRKEGFAEYIPSQNDPSAAGNVPPENTEVQTQVEPRPEDIPQQAVQDPTASADQPGQPPEQQIPAADQPGQADPSN